MYTFYIVHDLIISTKILKDSLELCKFERINPPGM